MLRSLLLFLFVALSTPLVASGDDVKLFENQRYCESEGKAGLCDVYKPNAPAPSDGYPVVVVVHGGGWISGDKWTLEGYSRLLARNGYVAVTINYRLAPEHKFPAQVDDVRQALLWVKTNASRFSLDLKRLGMFGYSAGGHLSALVAALADEPVEVQSEASSWDKADEKWNQLPSIRAVCAGGPPCDFRGFSKENKSLSYFLGGSRGELPGVYRAASPAAHVSKKDPVTQIIHGDQDIIVPIEGSREFHQAQVDAGVDSRLHELAGQGHMVTFINPKTSELLLDFFRDVL
ncbi:MAG: alpha/beta hydrolase [Planctomycetota bacterium]